MWGLERLANSSGLRPAPGPPNDVRARTISQGGSVSYETSGLTWDENGEQPTPNYGSLPTPEQLHNVSRNYLRPSPPHPGPVTFASPNPPPLLRNSVDGGPGSGHPDTQILPSQGQGRVPGQPPCHHLGQNGQPVNHFPPPRYLFPPLPHSIPVFGQLHDPVGQTVGLVHQGSYSLSTNVNMGPGPRQLPPGWHHTTMYRPLMYPQIRPQVQMQGPVPMNWNGPPPPYPEPGLAPGRPTPRTNQAGPPTNLRRTSGTQPQNPRLDPGCRPGDDGTGLSVRPAPRRESTGRGPTRTNPPRKARPTKLCESD